MSGEPVVSTGARRRSRSRLPRLTTGLPPRRRLAGLALAALLLPVSTVVLALLRDTLDLTSDVLVFLLVVVAVALVGGLWPAIGTAVAGCLLLNYFFTEPLHRLTVADRDNALALVVFASVGATVSAAVDLAARRTREAAQAVAEAEPLAEADRTRAALLAAVSHDLRSPLASAKASVTALRSAQVRWSPQEHAELLATADESLDRLTRLVDNLLDMSRLQAGALAVFPQPVGLEDVLPTVLDELGPAGHRVDLRLPPELPEVYADPGLLERILANVTANALRHSPRDGRPFVSASASGGRVELRVVDRGPGVPDSEWERIFVPFQRLGDRDTSTGVGLGLALARGLAEAMGGTLEPARTPGGGLTMVLSLPAVPVPHREGAAP